MSHHQSLFGLDLLATACFSCVLCHDDIHNHAKIKHFYAFLEFSKHRNMFGFVRGGGGLELTILKATLSINIWTFTIGFKVGNTNDYKSSI